MRDGACGGSRGATLGRFDNSREDNSALDEETFKSMTKTRWPELEQVHKLCDNSQCPKRGQPGCDPAHKFTFTCGVLAHSVNALTKNGGLDLCGDKTTWPHSGHGEAKSGLTGLIQGKPGIARGGQIAVVSDREQRCPRAFLHPATRSTRSPSKWQDRVSFD